MNTVAIITPLWEQHSEVAPLYPVTLDTILHLFMRLLRTKSL